MRASRAQRFWHVLRMVCVSDGRVVFFLFGTRLQHHAYVEGTWFELMFLTAFAFVLQQCN